MKKQLFFDDVMLFGRDNVVRKYGRAEPVAVFRDGVSSTDLCTGYVFRLDDGSFRMLYCAHSNEFKGMKLFVADSSDGINFLPMNEGVLSDDGRYSHEIMSFPGGSEVAFIFEDKLSKECDERYKLLMTDFVHDELTVYDRLYVSSDLLHWTLKEGVSWGDGTEPLASVFYNSCRKVYTVIERPFWGIRSVGYKETRDWKNFSEFSPCVSADAQDDRLAEVYGMYAFEYDGLYIGIPHMYRGLKSEFGAKYKNGIIDTQLAYSSDGRYWKRSLRKPFISGVDDFESVYGKRYNMMWVFNVLKCEDGSINIYSSASEKEHGVGFSQPGTGVIVVHKMRNDGFICLATEKAGEIASVITREKVWHGGEMHINLTAKKATLAVHISDESEILTGNALGISKPLDGYGHDECIPFSGDSTNWVPEYIGGRTLDELKGKTLVFELRFEDGEVYSFSGDFTDVFNTQGARYRKFGVLPE